MAMNSLDLPLGSEAADFTLLDVVRGTHGGLPAHDGRPLVVAFLCRHCPYVKLVLPEFGRITQDYAGLVAFVGVSSNDAASYPDDAPESLAEMMREQGFDFPLYYDEEQQVARAYRAVCTPEFYVFDPDRKLAYHGQLDESRPKNDLPRDGRDLRAALDAVLSRNPVPEPQRPAVGCSIKWKADAST